jgi:predicted lipoprotein
MNKLLTTFTLILLLMLVLISCKLAVIRPLDPETGKAKLSEEEAQKVFNAESYVAERWEDPLITTMQNDSVNLPELLLALEKDSDAASEQFGQQQGNSPYSFMVRGEGKVLELNTESRAGLLTLDLEPLDDQADISLAVGPVIKGTALRDAMPFIKFNDFTNQLEFADVSKKLHERVLNEVIASTDLTTMPGKTISFLGTFAFTDLETIVITPVELKVVE